MEKSKSIISWGQLFIIFGTVCLFLFAMTQSVNLLPKQAVEPEIPILEVTGYNIKGGTISGYDGDNPVLEIPCSYSLGETTTISGTITFNYEWQAFEFMDEYYSQSGVGAYDFYNEIYTHDYPWTYEYSIEQPSFVAGDDFLITSIESGAFEYNDVIETVIIPSQIEEIGSFAFQNCSNLKNIQLSEGLKTIGDSAFWGCAMETIELPDSLEVIYPYAFFYCHNLKEITIPKNVREMMIGTFNGCENLKKVTILSENEIEAWGTNVYHTFSNCTSLEEIYVPKNMLSYYQNTYPWNLYTDKYKTF